jgi:LysR family transcriptional regulator, hydrogen peroxide-inducible genes activator
MTLSQLAYVVAVDRHRHFTRAAEAAGVTQPTLSMQIRKLEKELGIEIFDRSRTPVRPTDLGAGIVEQARAVLHEAERLRGLARIPSGEVVGELRVGIIPTLGPFILPSLLPELIRRHPRLTLTVEEVQTAEILEGLRTESLDAGVIATPADRPGLLERELFEEPFVAYLSRGHPLEARAALRAGDLRLDDLWLLQEGHCFRDQVKDLCSRVASSEGRSGRLRFQSGNLGTLKRMVDGSGGMTLLPLLATRDLTDEERSRVRPFRSPVPTRLVRLVQGRAYLKRPLVEALAEQLLVQCPEELRRPPAGGDRAASPKRSRSRSGR